MAGLFINDKDKTKIKKSWTERIERRTARWAKKRHANGKTDEIPHTVTGRRTYIIPTRFGAVFGLAIFVMLLGAMNYSNSLAFIMTFMLAAIVFVSMHLTNFNLSGVIAEPIYSESVFAGDPAIIKVGLSHNTESRPQVIVSNAALEKRTLTKLDIERTQKFAPLIVPTIQRGFITLDHYILSTRFPLNLFHAWTVVFQPLRCLVYPKPAEEAPEIYGEQTSEDNEKTSQRLGQDDFAGLRDYQWQDSPQHIAWKTYAASNKLMVKTYHESVAQTMWFDLDALEGNDLEQRLSVLCRLILDADKAKQNYGLRLGEIEIAPQHGEKHRHECLRALALFGKDNEGTTG